MKDTVPADRATVRQIQFIGRRYAVLEVQSAADFRHSPGQFTKVSFSDSEGTFDRFYSIASAPQNNSRFELCIALDDDRIRRLLATWTEGSTLTCARASGRFPIPSYDRAVVCIAGGSGITPLRAIIEDRVRHGTKASTVLLYGCQSDDEIPFYHSLTALLALNPGLSLFFYADEAPLGRALPGRPLNHLTQHLAEDADYVLCGPPGFMAAAHSILEKFGIPKEAILQDRF